MSTDWWRDWWTKTPEIPPPPPLIEAWECTEPLAGIPFIVTDEEFTFTRETTIRTIKRVQLL